MINWRQGLLLTSLATTLTGTLASYWLAHQAAIADHVFDVGPIGTYTVIQYAMMTLAMLVALMTARRAQPHELMIIMVIGVVCRLCLLPVDAYTSNDIARYLFDGKLALEGFDPYRISHDASALEALRATWQPPAEHAQYVTLYPPLALGLFTAAASAGIEHAQWVWKLMTTAASIATLFVGFRLLQITRRLAFLPLIALSPLLILEAGIGAHLDAFSTLAIALSLLALFNKRLMLAGLFIGLGTLLKLLPLAVLLPAFFQCQTHRQRAAITVATLATAGLGYALIYAWGFQPIGSIGVFFAKWRFGSPFFNAIDWLLQGDELIPTLAALFVVGCLGIIAVAWQQRLQPHQSWASLRLLPWQLALALPLLLSPVVFPWYLMPLAFLCAFACRGWILVWISLLPLTYEVLNLFILHQLWQPACWPLWAVALGMQAAVIVALLCRPRCECRLFSNDYNKVVVCFH